MGGAQRYPSIVRHKNDGFRFAQPIRFTKSKQRRKLRYLDRAEKHRAVDEAQREGARFLAFEFGRGAERVDAGGDAYIGVLLHDLAETRDRLVERAEEVVEVLTLDAGCYAIERRLRHALLQHFLDTERRNHLLDACDRHLQFAFDPAAGVEAQRSRGNRDHVALLDPRPYDFDMAARGLDFAETLRPRLWREILQPAQLGLDVGIERRRQQRMHLLDGAAGDLQHGFDHRMILRRTVGDAAVQFDMAGLRQRRLHWTVDAVDRGIVEYDGGALRIVRQSGDAAAASGPVHLHRRRLAAIGNRRRRLEVGNQQVRLVDLRDHHDFA